MMRLHDGILGPNSKTSGNILQALDKSAQICDGLRSGELVYIRRLIDDRSVRLVNDSISIFDEGARLGLLPDN